MNPSLLELHPSQLLTEPDRRLLRHAHNVTSYLATKLHKAATDQATAQASHAASAPDGQTGRTLAAHLYAAHETAANCRSLAAVANEQLGRLLALVTPPR